MYLYLKTFASHVTLGKLLEKWTQSAIFHEKWTSSYFFIEVSVKAVCLVCSMHICTERIQPSTQHMKLFMPTNAAT